MNMVEDSDKNHALFSLYPILKDNPLKTSGIYYVIAFSAQKTE